MSRVKKRRFVGREIKYLLRKISMKCTRLISRLDIKGARLIKGVSFEGLRVVGDPYEAALSYYKGGIDEIFFLDAVASLYGRNNIAETISKVAAAARIPLSVGGGIRSVADAEEVFRIGADKVVVNTAAIRNPELITNIAHVFGSSSIVLSIEAKRTPQNGWEALTEYGRQRTDIDAVQWAKQGVDRGAGEVLVSSVDLDGTRRGFDIDLIRSIAPELPVPVIASGGMGNIDDLIDVVNEGRADAVAVSTVLHYGEMTVRGIKTLGTDRGLIFAEH